MPLVALSPARPHREAIPTEIWVSGVGSTEGLGWTEAVIPQRGHQLVVELLLGKVYFCGATDKVPMCHILHLGQPWHANTLKLRTSALHPGPAFTSLVLCAGVSHPFSKSS